MNHSDSIHKFFQKKDQLTLVNKHYAMQVHDLIVWLLKNDEVQHDLTTENLFPEEKRVNSRIITRQKTTIAGLEEVAYLIATFTKLEIQLLCKDGDHLEANQEIMHLKGDVREILAYERFFLNILQRLSGIATETHHIVSKLRDGKPYIAATRKTVWGPLDKKAVAIGGGLTHRLSLADGILVKDNHLMLISATEALQKLLQTVADTLIEIEVEDEENLNQLVTLFTKTQTNNVLGILLDNFSPAKAKQVLASIKKYPNVIYEASGGITTDNINEWAKTGVDIISLGALTHSPKAADISLDIIE